MLNPIKKSIAYGSHTLTLETGEIARQANGAVVASLGDTVVLNTGLRYINTGTPAGSPVEWCDPVSVHYTAYLANGTRLESTRDTELPLAFTPGFQDLIDGFEQGVVGLQRNVVRRLIIPPQLGYGSEPVRNNAGVVIIPANSTLIYDVEIATP